MRAPLASLCFAALALAGRAHAQGSGSTLRSVTAQLDYQLRDGAEGRCPDAAFLVREVAARLGFDAFAPDAPGMAVGRVRVTITRNPRGFVGQVDYEDTAGALTLRRLFPVNGSTNATCEILVARFVAPAVAWRLTILAPTPVEEPAAPPRAAPAPPPPAPAPTPAPAPQAPPAPAPAPPAPPPPSRSLHPRVEAGLAGFGSFGVARYPTLGGALHLGVALTPSADDRVRLVFAGELRVDAPATDAHGHQTNQTQLFAGSLVVCGSKDLDGGSTVTLGFLGCVVGTVGVLSGTVPTAETFFSKSATYGALGARLGFQVRFASLLLALPQVELLPTLVDPRPFAPHQATSVGAVTGTAGVAAAFLF